MAYGELDLAVERHESICSKYEYECRMEGVSFVRTIYPLETTFQRQPNGT